ncbi:MAG: cupin domain-containing protein [Mycobacteriales bacterium]
MIEAAGRWQEPDPSGATYVQHLATADLSVGAYCLRRGSMDTQSPHDEDEVYVVNAGQGYFTGGERTVPVEQGSVLFVPAGEPHRFHDIGEDLTVLVFFGPAYGSRAAS